ncbi:Response regulator receiver domain-containing protein [Ruaniaceae bacterium KH17]|nr:Response regulator receiver domain-containing protein [Ruaniaceae bacterium KH17]
MKLAILVLEDEAPVRTALARDLAQFAGNVRVEIAEDVDDAHAVIEEIHHAGDLVAVILSDHRLPGMTGVEFLVETMHDPRLKYARRVLVTGQAGHEDTIRAINEGSLSHYVSKPWTTDELTSVVRNELTTFVLDNSIDPLPYMTVLDSQRVMRVLRHRPGGAAV